jgi:hypothetical protein
LEYSNTSLDPWTLLGDPALMVRFPKEPLTLANASTRSDLQLPLPTGQMDSIHFEIVRVDSIHPGLVLRQQHYLTELWDYERETVVYSERLALKPGQATFRISMADTLNPMQYAVKVLVWNHDESHYGHFPLQSLAANTLAVCDARRERLSTRSRRVTHFGLPEQGWVRNVQGRKVPLR